MKFVKICYSSWRKWAQLWILWRVQGQACELSPALSTPMGFSLALQCEAPLVFQEVAERSQESLQVLAAILSPGGEKSVQEWSPHRESRRGGHPNPRWHVIQTSMPAAQSLSCRAQMGCFLTAGPRAASSIASALAEVDFVWKSLPHISLPVFLSNASNSCFPRPLPGPPPRPLSYAHPLDLSPETCVRADWRRQCLARRWEFQAS